jgi:hypothetical protein
MDRIIRVHDDLADRCSFGEFPHAGSGVLDGVSLADDGRDRAPLDEVEQLLRVG